MHDADGGPAWPRRAVKLWMVAMAAASLVLAGLLLPWDDLLSSDPSSRPHPGPGGSLIGEAEGWVKGAAPSTNTIRVSSGLLGLSSVTLVVTADTLIMVDGKEGAFDDLHQGRWVRAAYEAYPNGLRAKRIEVLVGAARAEDRRAVGSPAPNATLPARTVVRPLTDDGGLRRDEGHRGGALPSPPGRTQQRDVRTEGPASPPKPPNVRSAPATPSPSSIPPDARSVPGNPAAPVVRQGSGAPPSPRPSVVADPPPDERRSGAPARNDDGPRAPSREPRQAQAADPGAVIDWLLKESPASGQ